MVALTDFIINYAGITSLGDFAISESGDYTVFTSSGGDVIQFKNIENLSVGGIAYTQLAVTQMVTTS